MTDVHLARAIEQVEAVLSGRLPAPDVRGFFDIATNTISYVVSDPATKRAAVIDSVRDFDSSAARTGQASVDAVIAHVREQGLTVDWVLETHAHADHLSAAPAVQEALGGQIAIGRGIVAVQAHFGKIFNESAGFPCDGSQFDRLLDDGDRLEVGSIPLIALQVPGHTPSDMAYLIGDALFTGDTIFMPDYGSARTDFPGGDARTLYRSVRRLLELPGPTRMFLCHDYKAPNRDEFRWETTVDAQRRENVHLHDGVAEEDFVTMRTERDATLPMPKLILPSLQVNIRAGRLPDAEDNGVRYLKVPLNHI